MSKTITMKSVLGTILMLSLFTFNVHAQKWTRMDQSPDILEAGLKSAVGFTVDGIGYVVGGVSRFNPNKSALFRYDIGGDDWTGLISFEGGIRSEAIGFGINGKGYIVGGTDENGNYKNDVWEFDPVASTWTPKTDFPGGARASAVVFVIGNKAYIGTGHNGTTYYNDLYEYTPATDSWVAKASLPAAARQDGVAFAIETKGYVGTGLNASGVTLNDFWEYDPSLDSWSTKANFPGGTRTSAVGLSYSKKGFVGTGNNGATNYKDFWEYTAATNTWAATTDFADEARHEAASLVIGAKLCVVDGQNSAGTILKNSYYYKQKYNYGFTITPDKICFGQTVVITNLTDDPDAYKYRFEAYMNPTSFVREDTLTDTIHFTPSGPGLNINVTMHVRETNGINSELAIVSHSLKVSQLDSVVITTMPDTCTGGVGRAIATTFSHNNWLPPYKYQWSNGVTNDTNYSENEVKNLIPGVISVIVTDAGGCTVSKSGIIGTYIDKPIVLITSTPDTCLGKVGELRAYPQTNHVPYRYAWSNTKTTAFISNLNYGKYTVDITEK
jgi:N-acetylneuraminic acid mutarotase